MGTLFTCFSLLMRSNEIIELIANFAALAVIANLDDWLANWFTECTELWNKVQFIA